MINCPTCKYYANDKCNRSVRTMGLSICPYAVERKPRNHFDMLKAMSMEELAEFIAMQRYAVINPIADKLGCDVTNQFIECKSIMLNWLKEEI